jgi:Kef-type K+ transport system membrane component KefB
VVGELLAGVLLGPAVSGLLIVSPELKGISMLGVFLLLLLAGMETRIEDLLAAVRGRGVWVSVLGFSVPFLLAEVSYLWGVKGKEIGDSLTRSGRAVGRPGPMTYGSTRLGGR